MQSGMLGVLFEDGSTMLLVRPGDSCACYLPPPGGSVAADTDAAADTAACLDVAGGAAADELPSGVMVPLRGARSPGAASAKVPAELVGKVRCLQRFERCLLQAQPYSSKCQPDVVRVQLPPAAALPAAGTARSSPSRTSTGSKASPARARLLQQRHAPDDAHVEVHVSGFTWTQGCLCLALSDGSHQLVFSRDGSVLLVPPGGAGGCPRHVAFVCRPEGKRRAGARHTRDTSPAADRGGGSSSSSSTAASDSDSDSDSGGEVDTAGRGRDTRSSARAGDASMQLVRVDDDAVAVAACSPHLLRCAVRAAQLQLLQLPASWLTAARKDDGL
jgi:hypothetical protein